MTIGSNYYTYQSKSTGEYVVIDGLMRPIGYKPDGQRYIIHNGMMYPVPEHGRGPIVNGLIFPSGPGNPVVDPAGQVKTVQAVLPTRTLGTQPVPFAQGGPFSPAEFFTTYISCADWMSMNAARRTATMQGYYSGRVARPQVVRPYQRGGRGGAGDIPGGHWMPSPSDTDLLAFGYPGDTRIAHAVLAANAYCYAQNPSPPHAIPFGVTKSVRTKPAGQLAAMVPGMWYGAPLPGFAPVAPGSHFQEQTSAQPLSELFMLRPPNSMSCATWMSLPAASKLSVVTGAYIALRPIEAIARIDSYCRARLPSGQAALPPGVPTGTVEQGGASVSGTFIAVAVGTVAVIGGLSWYLTRTAKIEGGSRGRLRSARAR